MRHTVLRLGRFFSTYTNTHRRMTWFIVGLALILRLPQLNGSFWLDEAAQALEVVRPFSEQLAIAGDFQPPLLHLILHAAQYLSHAEWWLRTVGALIPGVLTVWGVIQIGKIIHHPKVGLIAGLLLATSPFHIFFSQELRPYSLPTMIAVFSWLQLLQWPEKSKSSFSLLSLFSRSSARQSESLTRNDYQRIASFAILTAAGLYSSYLYPFLLISQGVYAAIYLRKQLACVASGALAGCIAFLPWIPFFLEQLQVGGELRAALPGWDQVVSLTQLKSLPLVFAKFLFGLAPLDLSPQLILVTVIIGSAAGFLVINLWHRRKLHPRLIPLLIWICTPLITAWLVSFFVPVIQPKRVMYLLPAMYLLVASLTAPYLSTQGLEQPKIWQRLLKKTLPLRAHLASLLLVVSILSLNIVGTVQYYSRADLQRENWRAVVSQIQTQFPDAETVVVFSFPEPFAPWRWYAKESTAPVPASVSTGVLFVDDAPNLDQTLAPVREYRYVLVFDYLRTLTDPQDEVLLAVLEHGFTATDVIEYPGIGFIRIYEARN